MTDAARLHSTLRTRGTEIAPEARGHAFALFALGYFVGGAGGAAVFGRLVDMGLHGGGARHVCRGLAALGSSWPGGGRSASE